MASTIEQQLMAAPIPDWYRIALAEYGQQEVTGAASNPRIAQYLSCVGHKGEDDSQVPWCSAFANWCMLQCGIKGSGRANARSWLEWGRECEPLVGCIVVLSAPARGPQAGHVGFLSHGLAENGVRLLGGNQANRVCVERFDRARVLGFRMP